MHQVRKSGSGRGRVNVKPRDDPAMRKNDHMEAEQSIDDDDFELPNPKEVNRQISAELAARRRAATKLRRNTGVLTKVAARAEDRFAGNFQRQVIYIFENAELPAGTGRKRAMSETTQTEHKEALMRVQKELKEERVLLRNLNEVSRKHVGILVKRWLAAGQSYGTIKNKVSKLRVILTLLGKPQVVPRDGEFKDWLEANDIALEKHRKSKIALEPKTWTVKGVDPIAVMAQMRGEHGEVAMCLEMMFAFGLRAREATHMAPIIGDLGDRLFVRDGSVGGAKGGKARTIPFSDDPAIRVWQRDALERAKVLARKHRQMCLSVPGKDYVQMKNHFYYVCRKYGVTGDGLGVLPHGLRHMYAHRRHMELTGRPAPVVATIPMAQYRADAERLKEGAARLSLEMGHVRPSITAAYNGSVHSQSKEEAARTQAWIDRFESCEGLKVLVKSLDFRGVYLSGKAAQGVRLQSGDSIRLLVDKDKSPQMAFEIEVLQRSVAGLIKLEEGLRVEVVHAAQAEERRDIFLELNLQA